MWIKIWKINRSGENLKYTIWWNEYTKKQCVQTQSSIQFAFVDFNWVCAESRNKRVPSTHAFKIPNRGNGFSRFDIRITWKTFARRITLIFCHTWYVILCYLDHGEIFTIFKVKLKNF